MDSVYQKEFTVTASTADRFDRLKISRLLAFLQEVSAEHCALLGADQLTLTDRQLFWAVLRHRVQIHRLPRSGETIRMETWPMPTTRTAYPRAAAAYDKDGNVLFQCVSLWVLMDAAQRSLVLPGKSGVTVPGIQRGCELALPGSMVLKSAGSTLHRTVRFTDLDCNGHMNNCRSLDWVADLLPADFHRENRVAEFSICYNSEALEAETLALNWELSPEGFLSVDALRSEGVSAGGGRVFSARVQFQNVVM